MSDKRRVRLEATVKKALPGLLDSELSGVAPGTLTTVASVRLTSDLGTLWVGLSVLGGDAAKEKKVLARLQHRRAAVRARLAKFLGLARAPRIEFSTDDSLAFQVRLTEIVRDDARTSEQSEQYE